jgi:glycosyltransferase involved in cell wall biosynthesis
MHILFLNPFHGGSHAAVAEGYQDHSQHQITLLTLPIYGGWRWRMRGGAVTLARMAREQQIRPDLLLASDMLDLATFRALTRDLYGAQVPAALYFHENQLTYPLPPGRKRDMSFAWINYTSALAADAVFFNSDFHRRTFLQTLSEQLGRYHDHQERASVDAIAAKASVLPPGINLRRHDLPPAEMPTPDSSAPPVILWNSRWEYDKQPQAFFAALEELATRGADFRLIVAGEHIDPNAPEFANARERWQDYVLHWGYAAEPADYSRLLHRADIVVSTALQEFFGISIIEALYCGCIPILPRRLSYPDLLPAEHRADCLYRSPAELVERLHSALLRRDELRQRNWRAIAAPFDWSLLAPRYDAALAAVRPAFG